MYKMYDYKCMECSNIFEHLTWNGEEVICPECKGKCGITWTKAPNKDWFPEGGMWMEHFDVKPTFVKSKQHLKDLCLKHNMTSSALGDVRNITEI